jgi:lysophospholipase L1-like esterase
LPEALRRPSQLSRCSHVTGKCASNQRIVAGPILIVVGAATVATTASAGEVHQITNPALQDCMAQLSLKLSRAYDGSRMRVTAGRALRAGLLVAGMVAISGAAQGTGAEAVCAPLDGGSAALGANDNHAGVIDLYFFGAAGATVSYYECDGSQATLLGQRAQMRDGYTPMYGATTWSCQRRTRRFAATVTLADGTVRRGLTDIRTPSCAERLRLYAPMHAAHGHGVTFRIRDRWGIGAQTVRWCLTGPGAPRACHMLRFVAGQRNARRSFVPDRRGRWTVTLIIARYQTSASIAVGVRAAAVRRLPRILATGDSTMQGVDVALADEFAGSARVLGDVHPGAGLSHTDGWLATARRQATTRRASVVVLSIGADEGWPMTGPDGTAHECCDADWSTEYARRMRQVLTTYRRHARVIVLTVVDPRTPGRAAIVSAARNAIIAVAGPMSKVRVVRVDRLFTPDGYQDAIRYRGREIAVREPDGVHLNVAGTTIEAREAAPLIRELLPRERSRDHAG